uniref:Uncharacterized protein n=1 Tax=viral metagenome TaxID=1070528 RepID=A0A6C0B084_9ZZZZ
METYHTGKTIDGKNLYISSLNLNGKLVMYLDTLFGEELQQKINKLGTGSVYGYLRILISSALANCDVYLDYFEVKIKGMGKFMLCMAISILIHNKLSFDKVCLHVVSLRKDPELEERLKLLSAEELVEYIFQFNRIHDYQETINFENSDLNNEPTKEIMIKNVSLNFLRNALIENLSRDPTKLKEYYRSYGFREKEYTYQGIFMEAELADILKNCKELN